MKKFTLLSFICFSLTCFAQHSFLKQFSLTSDNDLYISIKKDQYYTNGLFLNYRYLSTHSNKKVLKRIYNFEFAQQMYTPYLSIVNDVSLHDRPFAGYLFGNFGIDLYFKSNTVLKTALKIGVLGPMAHGEEVMNFVHNLYGYKKAEGWKYQIANTFALNLETAYIKPLWITNSKTIDINWCNSVRLGTIFTKVNTGIYSRFSLLPLKRMVNSIAFGGNLNQKNLNKSNGSREFFIYVKPSIGLVGYDATIQGSLFNDNSPVTFDIKHFQYTADLGVLFSKNRYIFEYSIHYYSKKLKSPRVPNINSYATIKIAYQFN
ncbi:lipid A deacylase LpxR family protein [Tenacibaculum sp. UWU-22]|uniref:lipid A deacylase LpxR family protein n=1 Tax=Tenacibaculum sp. UWU-22 TaxID=3234187 RepID=UPI0034DB53F7